MRARAARDRAAGGAPARSGSVVVSATNGKTTTAAMVAVDPRAHRHPARAQPRRREHGRRRGLRAGRRARAAARARRRPRAVRGRRVLARPGRRGARPARAPARQPVPRPARPLRRAGDDRRPLGGRRGRAGRPHGARAQRRRPAGRRPRARRGARSTSASRTTRWRSPELQHASDSKHCRRCGHAYVYEAAYLAHLGRYHCPNCGARRPEPAVARHRRRASRHPLAPRSRCARPAARRGSSCPLPGLYNVYNALGAAALCLRSARRSTRSPPGLAAVAPAFGRAETLDLDGRATSILLVKNPAGANEVLRTLALEGGELDLFGVLNDRIADGRDVSWVWDADWELLAPHVRRMTCSGTRAAELALRLKYAGVDTDRLHVVERRSRRRSTGARRRATARCTSCPPTPRCSSCATCSPRGGGERARDGTRRLTRRAGVIWHDVECGGYAADLPLWRELAARGGRADARRRRGHGARRAAPRPRRARGHGARPSTADLLAALRDRARGRGLDVPVAAPTRADFDLGDSASR